VPHHLARLAAAAVDEQFLLEIAGLPVGLRKSRKVVPPRVIACVKMRRISVASFS
jgi:hypothetical protein